MNISINVKDALEIVKINKEKSLKQYQQSLADHEVHLARYERNRELYRQHGRGMFGEYPPTRPSDPTKMYDTLISVLEKHVSPIMHLDSLDEFKAIYHNKFTKDFIHALTSYHGWD